jgi:hypothetical protein
MLHGDRQRRSQLTQDRRGVDHYRYPELEPRRTQRHRRRQRDRERAQFGRYDTNTQYHDAELQIYAAQS